MGRLLLMLLQFCARLVAPAPAVTVAADLYMLLQLLGCFLQVSVTEALDAS